MTQFHERFIWADERLQGEPRYAIQGSLNNASIELLTPVMQQGTPFTAARMNSLERAIFNANAFGITFGTGKALQANITGWQLEPFAECWLYLHESIRYRPSLNINNEGAKNIMVDKLRPMSYGMREGALFRVLFYQPDNVFLATLDDAVNHQKRITVAQYLHYCHYVHMRSHSL